MEEISCIFCETTAGPVVIEENGYQARRCTMCGLIYVSPRPEASATEYLYTHGEAHLSPAHHLRLLHLKRLYARHHLRLLRRFGLQGSVLEIGAGAGAFLAEAQALGLRPYGIELNSIQASHVREDLGIPCEERPLGADVFPGEVFDVIYHCDVVSHFRDPLDEFRTMHQRLRDDGLLVFETGNLPDVDSRVFHRYRPFQLPDHLFFFGRDSLRLLLDRTGFELVDTFAYGIEPQLLAMKALRTVMGLPRALRPAAAPVAGSAAPAAAPPSPNAAPSLARRAFDWIMYFLRYYAGRVAPKRGRQQTLLIVARKRRAAAPPPPV